MLVICMYQFHGVMIANHMTHLSSYCRQAQLHQGHDDYQSVARREQREQEKRRADQARDAERKTREEVSSMSSALLQLGAI